MKNKNLNYTLLILTLVIFIQLIWIIHVFSLREGYHSDENWSYGFANNFYKNNPDDIISEWQAGSVFSDYITVNPSERFRLDAVYNNQKYDMSPPLYSMLLHIVCSFFPNTFSWYYAFALNLLLFIFFQIYFFKLSLALTKSNKKALAIVSYYGFTYAAVNCYVYLRMYALLSVETILFLNLQHTIMAKKYQSVKRELILSALIIVLGGLTHYYFFVIAFFIVALSCLFLLYKKNIKMFLIYGTTMLAGVLVAFAIFPYAITNMLSGTTAYNGGFHLPYYWNLTTCLSLILNETIGILWNVNRITFLLLGIWLFFIILILSAICFLCRKELWFITGFQTAKKHILSFVREPQKGLQKLLSKWDSYIVILFISLISTILVVAKISYVEKMGEHTNRYLFNLMPIWVLLFSLLIFKMVPYIVKKTYSFFTFIIGKFIPKVKSASSKKETSLQHLANSVIIICLCIFMALNLLWSRCTVLYPTKSDGEKLVELTTDANVIVDLSVYWHLVWYSSELTYVNKVYGLLFDKDLNIPDNLKTNNDTDHTTYLIVEANSYLPDDIEVAEDGSVTMEMNSSMNYNGCTVHVKDFTQKLIDECDWIKSLKLIDTKETFCGELRIYQLN